MNKAATTCRHDSQRDVGVPITAKENFITNTRAKLFPPKRLQRPMKRKILLLLIIIFAAAIPRAFAQTEADISQIRSDTLRTSKLLSTFKKETKFVDGISVEGTEATFYTSTAGLKMIHAEMAGETYYATVDFYYHDSGKLNFVYYKMSSYDTQIGMDPPPKIVNIEEKRLYYKDGKLIRRIVTKTETFFSDHTAEPEIEILDLEKKFKESLKD